MKRKCKMCRKIYKKAIILSEWQFSVPCFRNKARTIVGKYMSFQIWFQKHE